MSDTISESSGLTEIRRRVLAWSKGAHLGNVARDCDVALDQLESFAVGRRATLPPVTLDKLARYLIPFHAYDASVDAIVQVDPPVPQPTAAAPVPFPAKPRRGIGVQPEHQRAIAANRTRMASPSLWKKLKG